MRRLLKKYGVATVMGLAALGLVIVMARDVVKAYGATNAPNTAEHYYPPLLSDFQVSMVNAMSFAVVLDYGGGLNARDIYPQLGKNDTIPVMRVQLTLPPGARIVKSAFHMAPPNSGKFYKRYPARNFRWTMVSGHPTWTFYNLRSSPLPSWQFWLTLPVPTQPACVKADAQGLFFRKVKKGGRTLLVLVPIPHAPNQNAEALACASAQGTTTTTATTTTP